MGVRKKELRRRRRSIERRELLISAYVEKKYKDIYTEATEYYETINTKYPVKFDLRKTEEFKQLGTSTITKPTFTDNLRLEIPLIDHETLNTEEVPDEGTVEFDLAEELPSELVEEAINQLREEPEFQGEEVLEEYTIQPSLDEDVPSTLLEKIINDLREEPELEKVFASVEEQLLEFEQQMEFERLGEDIDIDEHEQTLLQYELPNWENW